MAPRFSEKRTRAKNLAVKQAAIEATTERLTSQPKMIPQHPAIISNDDGRALEIMLDAQQRTGPCIANPGEFIECDSERTPPYAGMTTNLKVNIAYRDPLAATKYFRGSELDFTKKLARIVATFRNLESLRVLVQVATESNHNTNVKQYVWHHLKHLVWWYKYEFPELELYIWAVEDDCWNKIEEGSMVDRRMVNYRESLRIAGVL